MRTALTRRGRFSAIVAALSAVLAAPSIASATTVSAWNMDETSGSTMHDSVGSNNGTLHDVATGEPGFVNSAFGFNGSSSVVTVPTSASLNPGASPFWFSAHVKFTGTPSAAIGGDYDLIRKGLSGTSGGFYKMELLPSGSGVRAHCSMEGSSTSHSLTAGPDLRDGQWHTVECAKDDSSISVIVDGVKTSTSITLGSFGNNAQLAIGAKAEGGDWYDGVMDEASFGTGAPGDVAVAPTNTVLPAIAGNPTVGSQLTVSTGGWDGTAPIGYAYQWQRCNAAGKQCTDLAGATLATYTPVAGDEGRRLQVTVTAKNAGGSRTATSAPTGAVAAPAPPSPPSPGGAPPPATSSPAPAAGQPGTIANPVTVVAGSCTRVLPATIARTAKLSGHTKVTLRFDARTGAVRVTAPHGKVRTVTVTLDGKRLRSVRGGRLATLLHTQDLARGGHVLRATIHPRRGKVLTLTVLLVSTSC